MTSSKPDQPLFTENLRAPGWMFAFLGLMLGAVSGGLTAVGIRGFTDDPLISGGESLIFYVSFTIAIIGIVYVMLNSTLMETKATADGMTVRLGVLGTQRTFDWNNITAIRTPTTTSPDTAAAATPSPHPPAAHGRCTEYEAEWKSSSPTVTKTRSSSYPVPTATS